MYNKIWICIQEPVVHRSQKQPFPPNGYFDNSTITSTKLQMSILQKIDGGRVTAPTASDLISLPVYSNSKCYHIIFLDQCILPSQSCLSVQCFHDMNTLMSATLKLMFKCPRRGMHQQFLTQLDQTDHSNMVSIVVQSAME